MQKSCWISETGRMTANRVLLSALPTFLGILCHNLIDLSEEVLLPESFLRVEAEA